ncbi:hypothetical protein [Streptomyces sp. KHY 26]|uniref:hypothetical protein n=1 Tax=Streptomyces sp. KHY 26 TaxID=3097359 RepID=UPI00376EAEAB
MAGWVDGALRRAWDEWDPRPAADADRGPGARRRFEPLVERLRTPAAAFPRTESEQRLARHVDADDPFARDHLAHAPAGALSVIDSVGTRYFGRVTDAARDPPRGYTPT